VLTSDEMTSLYNTGRGKAYADLTADEKVGLVSYWNLDETSGTRYDSHGSNTLTDNNTVTSATNSYPANLPGTVASFVAANNESLSYASAVTPSAPWSMSGWFYIRSTAAAYESLIDGGDSGADPGQWGLYANAPDAVTKVQLLCRNSGDSLTATGITADAWNLIYIETDGAGNPSVSVNNGALVTGSLGDLASTAFHIGKSAPGNYFSGLASVGAVWNRVLTADERTALFNSGNGAPLP